MLGVRKQGIHRVTVNCRDLHLCSSCGEQVSAVSDQTLITEMEKLMAVKAEKQRVNVDMGLICEFVLIRFPGTKD